MFLKNNIYICISKNDKYLSKANTDKIIKNHKHDAIMKKTLLRKAAMASLFTLMTLTVTKANAKETFIYGETDNGLIVSTLNEDGKTLTPKWKYEYQYDEQGRLTEKKAYRWNL